MALEVQVRGELAYVDELDPQPVAGLLRELSIARDLVKAHGATLSVVASSGAGTRFAIWLPGRRPGALETRRD